MSAVVGSVLLSYSQGLTSRQKMSSRRVQAPLEELQDSGLPAAPRRVDADRDRVQVSAGDDRLHNIDDIFEAEQVNLARVVVAQRHGRMGDACVAHQALLGGLKGQSWTDRPSRPLPQAPCDSQT